jgi:hypothetical protein
MGIMGSLRVSNFSFVWVTDSPFLSCFDWVCFRSSCYNKIITHGKRLGPEYLCVPLYVARKFNNLGAKNTHVVNLIVCRPWILVIFFWLPAASNPLSLDGY